MRARHPVTGQPIAILRSEATLHKNATSAVWIRPSFTPSHRWSRWTTILSESSALPVLQGNSPSLVLVTSLEEQAIWKTWASTHENSIVFISKVPSTEWIQVSDLQEQYPFLGSSSDTSDEELIARVVTLFRQYRLYWASSHTSPCLAHVQVQQLNMDATDACIPRSYWIYQYFEHNHPRRSRELYECLEKNLTNPYIDHVILITEKSVRLPSSEKLQVIPFGKRVSYADTFQIAMDKVPKGHQSILLFSNADIQFDDTLRHLWSLDFTQKVCLALLRWENGVIFGPRPDSQDTWILGRDSLDLNLSSFQFPYGQPGCDNVVAVELLRQKYLMVNPAYTIQTHHHHSSSIRSYDARADVLYNAAYLYIDPTSIQTIGLQTSIGTPLVSWTSSNTSTLCHIHTLKGSKTSSYWTPSSNHAGHLYHMEVPEGLFVTPQGLLHDGRSLWIGKEDRYKQAWKESTMSLLTPTRHLPKMIAMEGAEKDLASWALYSLPILLRIHALAPGAIALVPANSLTLLEHTSLNTRPYDAGVQYWSQNVWAHVGEHPFPTAEDITELRKILPATPVHDGPTILFLVSNELLEQSQAEQIYRMHCMHTVDCETKTQWKVQYLSHTADISHIRTAFSTADWIVSEGTHPLLPWCWMAPPGTRLLEFQQEDKVSETISHIANVSGHIYIRGLQRFREPLIDQRQQALVDVGIAIRLYGTASLLQELKEKGRLPVVVIPTGKALQGIHVHAGDAFRAMVELWAERGYCTVQRSEETPYCWWGEIGDTLLYDRDTLKWWNMTPPICKMALMSNPSVVDRMKQSVWSYWPRYPALVEAVRPCSWSERSITSLFLGRIENSVQKAHRQSADWKSALELFECPIDSTGGPYKYSPSEYLDQLCKAKFGLCLPGFGQKCHREMEYYVCGVIPIVTPGCDMTEFLNPPKEGVHYFRANTPEEVQKIIATVSRSTWERMSLAGISWWKSNASAEGLFRLTATRIQECRPYAGIRPIK